MKVTGASSPQIAAARSGTRQSLSDPPGVSTHMARIWGLHSTCLFADSARGIEADEPRIEGGFGQTAPTPSTAAVEFSRSTSSRSHTPLEAFRSRQQAFWRETP